MRLRPRLERFGLAIVELVPQVGQLPEHHGSIARDLWKV